MNYAAAMLCLCLAALIGCESTRDASPPLPTNNFSPVVPNAYSMDELDTPLKLLDDGPIEFPPEITKKNIEGVVTLSVAIDPNGHVIACVVEEADHQEVAAVVRSEIAKRTFSKPTVNGEPVDAYCILPVNYRIGEGSLMKYMKETDWNPGSNKRIGR